MKEETTFLLLVVSTILFSYQFVDGQLNQYQMPHLNEELVNGIEIEPLPGNVRSKRDASSNLRIYYDYQDSFTNSSDFQTLKTSVLEPARDQIQLLLQPKAPTNGILLVNRACTNGLYRINTNGVIGCDRSCTQTTCLKVVIPDKYLKQCLVVETNGNLVYSDNQGSGVMNYDIVLVVTYTSCGGDQLARAHTCFVENTLDRPILGVLILCSDKIQANVNVSQNIKIVMHEIIHALGFVKEKYSFYRYQNGTPIVPRNVFGWPNLGVSPYGNYNWNDVIIKSVVRNRSSVSQNYSLTFTGFVLPNVLKAARDHFNCPSLEVVDLEDYGVVADRLALNHFDEYLLNNELMTPVTNGEFDFLSKITLALLQDTGWYTVNMNAVGNLDYGYNQGCTLPQQGCYNFMKSQSYSSIYPFCNDPYQNGNTISCPSFPNSICRCGLYRYSNINQNQYFTTLSGVADSEVQYYKGISPYNEYCPVYIMASSNTLLNSTSTTTSTSTAATTSPISTLSSTDTTSKATTMSTTTSTSTAGSTSATASTSTPISTSATASTSTPISTSAAASTSTPISTWATASKSIPISTSAAASTSTHISTSAGASTSTPTSTSAAASESTPISTSAAASKSTPTSTWAAASTSTPISTWAAASTSTPISTSAAASTSSKVVLITKAKNSNRHYFQMDALSKLKILFRAIIIMTLLQMMNTL